MDSHERLIAKKLEWAKAKRGLVEDGVIQDHRARREQLPHRLGYRQVRGYSKTALPWEDDRYA
ncbi:MAG: hypothetical protein ACREIS_06095 [Nitrospiraceae bacterium]